MRKGSSDFPSNQSLSRHVWTLTKATCLIIRLKFPVILSFTWPNSIYSGEAAWLRRLAWTLAVRVCYNKHSRFSRNVRKRTLGRAPSEDSDQPAHSRSLIRFSTGRISDSQGYKDFACGQRRHWSNCADAQADLSLCWVSEGTFPYVVAPIVRSRFT